VKVDRFIVSGGSKRGWTTWTTAAVDDRVVAIVPYVIDCLNLPASMDHHYRAYGFWAPAVGDYLNIWPWVGTPQYKAPDEDRGSIRVPRPADHAQADRQLDW
jgi:PhoPQ-activated pathogenicity-related protein